MLIDWYIQFEDNEVGFVTGCIASHASSTIPILEPISTLSEPEKPSESELRTRPKTLGSRSVTNLPQSTMIGDLRLTVLKTRLATVGIQAEFAGEGVLVCGGKKDSGSEESTIPMVAVRKTGRGRVELEGSASDLYYTVRREVYNLHAVVAA